MFARRVPLGNSSSKVDDALVWKPETKKKAKIADRLSETAEAVSISSHKSQNEAQTL